MAKALKADISELKRLKGIHIGTTADKRQSLIFTYHKRHMNETTLAWICWLLVVAVYGVCGLIIWLTLQEYL